MNLVFHNIQNLVRLFFHYKKTLGFKLKPISAWTEDMANEREDKLEEIKRDKKPQQRLANLYGC